MKKPVRYVFLDFSTIELRRLDCMEEMRLNLRLAPGVYLSVEPLCMDPRGAIHLGGKGEVVDWLVCMRRLPRERMLDICLRNQRVGPADLEPVAKRLASFYAAVEPAERDGSKYRSWFEGSIRGSLVELSGADTRLPTGLVQRVHEAQLNWLFRIGKLVESRAIEGRVIEGHGDLRPEHVCLEKPPVIFDCLEFNQHFRTLDVADELAFLSMECRRLGADFVESTLLDTYARRSGDRPPPELVAFYQSCRASLRAKLGIWHLRDSPAENAEHWHGLAEEYLHIAEHCLIAAA